MPGLYNIIQFMGIITSVAKLLAEYASGWKNKEQRALRDHVESGDIFLKLTTKHGLVALSSVSHQTL